jgi:hypothetical protein
MADLYEEYEAQWAEYKAQQDRLEALTRRTSEDVVARVAQVSAAEPHMSPGVVLAAAESGADDDTVAYLAMQETDRLNEDPLYRRIASGVGNSLMFGLRAGLSGVQGIWWGGVGRPVTSWLTANNNISANKGVGGLFNPSNWMEELPQAYRAAGQAPIERQVRSVLRGEETDWRLSGDVWKEHYEQRESQITLGRFAADATFVLADQLGGGKFVEPGTRAHDFTKSVVDLGFEMVTDPTIFAGKTAQIAIAGRRTFAGVPAAQRGQIMGIIDGPRRTVIPEIQIDNWMSSREGALTMDWLAQTDDFTEIFRRIKNAEASIALRDANTVEEVADAVRLFAGRGFEPTAAPLALRVERAVENTRLARVWDQASDLMPDMPNWSRFSQWAPKYEPIPLTQPTEAVEQLTRWFINWEAPKDLTARLAERFARAVIAGDRHQAWGVWREANEELAVHLTKMGHNKDVVRSLSSMIGGPDFTTGTNQRAYWIEAVSEPGTNLMRGYDQVFDGQTWHRHISPHSAVELMDEAITMPNLLEIRRATSMLTRLTRVPRNESKLASDVYEVMFGLGPEFGSVASMKGIVWNTHDFLWNATTAVWMPLALVTRIAWPVRVTLEEQLRMGAVGLDAMFQHPISYIGWAMGNPESSAITRTLQRAGFSQKGLTDAVGDPIMHSRAFQDAMVRNRPQAYGGPGSPRPGAGAWDQLDMTRANVRQQITGFRIGMGKMWKDDVKQQVAEAILRGDNQLDSVYKWFYDSDLHRGMMSTSDEFSQLLSTPQGVRRWLDSQATEIRQLTGSDTELIESIATRILRDKDVYNTNLDVPKVNKIIASKIDELREQGLLHRFWVVPQDVIDMPARQNLWNQVTTQMFYMLGAVPSNVLSRSPVFKQQYWREITRLMDYADPVTQRELVKAAREANIPKVQIDDMIQRMLPPTRLPSRGAIDAAEAAGRPANVGDGRFVRAAEEADMLAKEFALRQANTLLYQLTERGQTLAAMRLIFPFGEAWKEIGLTWSRLMATNTHNLRRSQIIVDQARAGGFLYVDPITGQESYSSPGASLFGFAAGLPQDTRAVASSPVQGVNLFAGSAIPGVGPVFSSILGATLPDSSEGWRDLRNIVLPFGSTAAEPADLVNPDTFLNVLLPAWIKKALTATLEDGFDSRMWRSHVADAARVLGASGEYGQSEAEIRRLAEDSEDLAKKTLWFRAIGQATLPTGFRVDFQVQPDSPEAAEQMRVILGEDFEFGREDGGFISLAVLSSLWHSLREDADGDSFAATQAFLTMFGTDAENYDLYQWVASLGTGKTVRLTGRADDWRGRMWEENNAQLLEEIPAVVGLFAPVDDDAELDIAAHILAIQRGEKYQLTGEQFIIASQKIIGTAIWRETVRQTDGINTPEARAFRAQRQAWLDENLPYWRRDRTNVGVPQGYSWFQQVEQLERAVTFPEVLETPAGDATKRYMDAREQALMAIQASLPDVNNRQQAQIALQRRKSTEAIRMRLRQYGEMIAAETGEFEPIWDRILLVEVDDQEAEQ